MRPLKRKFHDKKKLTKKFNKHASKTKAANLKSAPMRGGFRL